MRVYLRRLEGESYLECVARIYKLWKGKRHYRYSIKLLGGGLLLVVPSTLEIFIKIVGISYPPLESLNQSQQWPISLGLFCILMSIIIFCVFEFKEVAKLNLVTTDPSSIPSKSLSALKYTTKVTPFIGRTSELELIEKFVNDNAAVSWWIIGGPGASGKSRLALEVCEIYTQKGWKCGFYNQHLSPDGLPNWNPNKSQLIVFDYAGNDSDWPIEVIAKAIDLYENSNLNSHIRVLLLDRDARSTIQKIKATQSFGEKLNEYLYDSSPLALEPLEAPELKLITSSLCEFFELESHEEASIYQYVIDSLSDRKILVAGLAALSSYQKLNPNDSESIEGLILELVQRERKQFWGELVSTKEKKISLSRLRWRMVYI